MIGFISIAAAALFGVSTLVAGAGASANNTISLGAPTTDLIFEQIVENAVADCREELSGDVFASFRLQSCVESRVSENVAKAGAPALTEYAAAYPDYLLTASAP